MARPRQQPEQKATRERLLGEAEGVFGERGFAAARLGDIAKAAGISRPSLLYHFASKEELYAAVVTRAFAQLGGAVEAPLAGLAIFREQLEGVVQGYAGFLDGHPAIARLILRELLDSEGPGAQLILEAAVPLLGKMENFLRRSGRTALRPGVPLRLAMMDVVFGVMVRAACGALREPLFGEIDFRMALLNRSFFKEF
jgi:AcrR family transcriptional regulator